MDSSGDLCMNDGELFTSIKIPIFKDKRKKKHRTKNLPGFLILVKFVHNLQFWLDQSEKKVGFFLPYLSLSEDPPFHAWLRKVPKCISNVGLDLGQLSISVHKCKIVSMVVLFTWKKVLLSSWRKKNRLSFLGHPVLHTTCL